MAVATLFECANDILKKPPGRPDVYDLPIFREPGHVVSCWRLTPEELAEVNRTGCVWLVAQGSTHPPILVMGTSPITVDGGNGGRRLAELITVDKAELN